ncbi:4-hydroxy-3-methylbut-2-enyl diphosphate reductase [Thiohalorhabdus methylotrophus]|uniref:4-hydroxy-3-methylbut-2-enyl diphosphate reductase n=1 Tax=Thiohalorhabdus methylotrophus TaxID=3242694 RepID=A0ABV4TWX3_9GAMM
MEILLANPRGFCAGVDRAIEIVERALDSFGAPIYVRHEVVHNRQVVDDLREKGAVFVEEVDEIPSGETAIFSAHGVSQEVRERAKARDLKVFDATCPLVTKVHIEVVRHHKEGREVVLIGHANHPEVEGTMGQVDGGIHLIATEEEAAKLDVADPDNLAYVTQTTLSVDDTVGVVRALKERFPNITGPRGDDICYATQNRQDAVKKLAEQAELILVVGAPNSSNSNRLVEVASRLGVPGHLVQSAEDIDPAWVEGRDTIGVTAGASAPESLVQGVITRLQNLGGGQPRDLEGPEEGVHFQIPVALRS